MSRVHLFEIEDQRWCPKLLRDFLTDYLRHFQASSNIYENSAAIIEKGLARASARQVVDLCTGGSGPWRQLAEQLPGVKITLTDLYPNQEEVRQIRALEKQSLNYMEESVNAMAVDRQLTGLRTMFSSFHHFRPEQAKKIIDDAMTSNEPIAIFEFTERKTFNYIFFPLLSILGVLLTTPVIRPFKWPRILFTYVIPVVPVMAVWDGYISNLRTYSVDEMKQLVADLNAQHYEWEFGLEKTKQPGINITYMLGRPRAGITQEQGVKGQPLPIAETES